ncbi:hypothetical protein WP39_06490 [Streptomyces sp. 604F]|nr:hypothetical protein [Streptomyces sp. 604F]
MAPTADPQVARLVRGGGGLHRAGRRGVPDGARRRVRHGGAGRVRGARPRVRRGGRRRSPLRLTRRHAPPRPLGRLPP